MGVRHHSGNHLAKHIKNFYVVIESDDNKVNEWEYWLGGGLDLFLCDTSLPSLLKDFTLGATGTSWLSECVFTAATVCPYTRQISQSTATVHHLTINRQKKKYLNNSSEIRRYDDFCPEAHLHLRCTGL